MHEGNGARVARGKWPARSAPGHHHPPVILSVWYLWHDSHPQFQFKNSEKFITGKLQNKIIRTRGLDGCDYQGTNYPVEKIDVRDTAGAGDSFMAALVAEYLNTADIVTSIISANIAASKVVQTRGVGVI